MAAPAGRSRRDRSSRRLRGQRHQLRQHRLPERAQAQHAHAALGRRAHRQRLPLPLLLRAPVGGHVTVQVEHGVRHVLHHPLHDAGFHHAHHRQVRRQRGEVELVDAGAGGEQQLQVRKLRPQVGRRHPGGKVARFVRVADLGPEPEVDLRRVAAEDLGPLLAALAVGLVDEDRPHQRLTPGPG
jgi:hypothetical protein